MKKDDFTLVAYELNKIHIVLKELCSQILIFNKVLMENDFHYINDTLHQVVDALEDLREN